MNEPTAVEARFAEDGRLTPLKFTWQGRNLPVVSTGRRQATPDGFRILVMTTQERVFELDYHQATGQWHITRASESRLSA